MRARRRILEHLRKLSGIDKEGWKSRHTFHWRRGGAIPTLIAGLASYIDDHEVRYGSKVGDDYVLGDSGVKPIIEGLLALLNGELDGLDAGTVDSLLREIAADANIDLGE